MTPIKIIYIVGDGRSGSTLLESILNNDTSVISVGEVYRFWERYYKGNTFCGCGNKIDRCELWTKIDLNLKSRFGVNYDVNRIKKIIKELCRYRNFKSLESATSDFTYLREIVSIFYSSLLLHSGKSVIVDSSKSPSWAKFIYSIPQFDICYIHLERNLAYVASSWKKKILLPEFMSKEVMMPQKSDFNILRTYIRVKMLGNRLRNFNYIFVKYEDLCLNPQVVINAIVAFASLNPLNINSLYHCPNHAIAGNPKRSNKMDPIIIDPSSNLANLNWVQRKLFKFINQILKFY